MHLPAVAVQKVAVQKDAAQKVAAVAPTDLLRPMTVALRDVVPRVVVPAAREHGDPRVVAPVVPACDAVRKDAALREPVQNDVGLECRALECVGLACRGRECGAVRRARKPSLPTRWNSTATATENSTSKNLASWPLRAWDAARGVPKGAREVSTVARAILTVARGAAKVNHAVTVLRDPDGLNRIAPIRSGPNRNSLPFLIPAAGDA